MGYEIHIQRSEPISQAEWTEYVKNDMSISEDKKSPGTYLWDVHPLGGIEGNVPWLHFHNGRISTRKPDEFLTLKMFEIAENLKADLLNDEAILENAYRIELEKHTQAILMKAQNKNLTKTWWKFW